METGSGDDKTKTALNRSSSNPEEQQHENEPCTPFCSCACCGHGSLTLHMNKITLARPQAKKQQSFFYNNISLSSDFFGNIWQPPKFS